MDILKNLIGESSVWIKSLVYDLSEYRLIINLIDGPDSVRASRQIVIPDIISFYETIQDFDDDLIDSIVGLNWLTDATSICLKTETREIIVKTGTQPYAQEIT